MSAPEANAEQIRYWNEAAGPKWVSFQKVIDAQIAPLGERAMDRAGIAPGERVIDVGCGCGGTTIALARRVGPAGLVLGIDISAPMLERAAETARAEGLANVRFENADAQTHRLPPGAFDVVYSRFGIMFFADPVAAFANLRAALRPGGRLAFVCWQALRENPWLFLALQAAAQHLTLPPPPAPDAPGPFSLADPERVRDIVARAGFERIALEDLRTALTLGGGGTWVVHARDVGTGPQQLRRADHLGREVARQRVLARVLDAAPPVRLLESVGGARHLVARVAVPVPAVAGIVRVAQIGQVAVGDVAEEADVLEAVAGHLLAEGVVEAPAGHDEVHAAPVAVGDRRGRARVEVGDDQHAPC